MHWKNTWEQRTPSSAFLNAQPVWEWGSSPRSTQILTASLKPERFNIEVWLELHVCLEHCNIFFFFKSIISLSYLIHYETNCSSPPTFREGIKLYSLSGPVLVVTFLLHWIFYQGNFFFFLKVSFFFSWLQ